MTKAGGWESSGFGIRLKALRETAALTQQELADKAGCHKYTVAKMEQGLQEPAWPLVLSLCDALGVEPNAFIHREPAPEKAGRGRPRRSP